MKLHAPSEVPFGSGFWNQANLDYTQQKTQLQLAECVPAQAITCPSSDVTYSKIRTWMRECKEKHRGCRLGLSGTSYGCNSDGFECSQLPTRVVDVGNTVGTEAKLIEPGLQCSEYASLSYCWGPNPGSAGAGALGWPHVTTSANLGQRLAGEPLVDMPKTISEAILVCQQIKLRYLWVDCLCIVQDDAQDWYRESRKMGEIYERTTVMIAALGAKDIHEGCFPGDRGSNNVGPFASHSQFPGVPLAFIVDGRNLGKVYVCSPMQDTGLNEIADSVWNERAWTFQERLLSRRIIYCGKKTATVGMPINSMDRGQHK